MKKILQLMIIITFMLLSGCISNSYVKIPPLPSRSNVKIVVASDLHYLSKDAYTKNHSISKPNYYGDGRVIVYSEEIIEAFINDMLIEKPDAVILSGDLTFDGSIINHNELTERLSVLVDNNIRVLVQSGNHDINTIGFYYDQKVKAIDGITGKQFQKMYYNYGFGNSVSLDENSNSYLYPISEDLYVLAIDTSIYDDEKKTYQIGGRVKEETLNWIDEELSKLENVDVIAFGHHNLHLHNTKFSSGYQIDNYQELQSVFDKHNVKLYLSGHMHIQSIKTDKTTEILTSSLSITNNHYGIIEYDTNQYNYYTKEIDMNRYATKISSTDENLLNFSDYSFNFFKESSYKKTYRNAILNLAEDFEVADGLATIQALLNPYYFSGNVDQILDELYSYEKYYLINEYKNPDFSNEYFLSMIASGYRNHNHEIIQIR